MSENVIIYQNENNNDNIINNYMITIIYKIFDYFKL